MKDFEIISCDKISNNIYESFVLYNERIYVTLPQKFEIIEYDMKFNNINVIKCGKSYKSLCFNEKCKCFFATDEINKNIIYKLDSRFEIIEYMRILADDEQYKIEIIGININNDNELILSGNFGYCKLNKLEKLKDITLKNIKKQSKYITVLEICETDYKLKILEENCIQYIIIQAREKTIFKTTLGKEFDIKLGNILYLKNEVYGKHKYKYLYIFLLVANKCQESYVIKMKIRYEEIFDELFCGNNMQNSCQHKIEKCLIQRKCHNKKICKKLYEKSCEKKCKKKCKKIKIKKICKDNSADVIQSIALIEASIAHILNAEGEKIQKAVCVSKSTKELLDVNESVTKTITKVINLEQILFAKLEIAKELCECNKKSDSSQQCRYRYKCKNKNKSKSRKNKYED